MSAVEVSSGQMSDTRELLVSLTEHFHIGVGHSTFVASVQRFVEGLTQLLVLMGEGYNTNTVVNFAEFMC